MTDSVPVQLGGVQETLLVPLYGRASLTEAGSSLISDPKSVEIVERLDYDFTRFEGSVSALGAVFRTRVFDHWIERWLADNPGGTVVEIGVGLNTRFERLDNGRARWMELDLPDVIELRQRFFADTSRRTTIAASVLDDSWHDRVAATGGPWLFSAEGVLIYMDSAAVASVISTLGRSFPGSLLATDTWTTWMAAHQDEHEMIGSFDTEFRWFCDDPTDFSEAGVDIEIVERCTLPEAPIAVIQLLPEEMRQAIPAMAEDPQANSYHLNLVALHPRL